MARRSSRSEAKKKRGRPRKEETAPLIVETTAKEVDSGETVEAEPATQPELTPVESEGMKPVDLTGVIAESQAAINEAEPKKRGRKPGSKNAKKEPVLTFGQATLKSVLSTPFLVLSVQTEVPEAQLTEEEATELASQGVAAAQAAGVDFNNPRVAMWAFIASFGMVGLGKVFAVYQARKARAPQAQVREVTEEQNEPELPLQGGSASAPKPGGDLYQGKGLKL